MIALVASIALALALGAALAAAFLRGLDAASRWTLAAALALPLGLGVTALQLLLWRAAGGGASWPLVVPELAALVAVAALASRRVAGGAGGPAPGVAPGARARLGATLACVAVALVVGIATWQVSRLEPSGHWDAWAMWSMKGRMLARAADWRLVLDPELPHPDYPLLLPAALARLLGLAPASAPVGPAVVAALSAAWTVLVPAAVLLVLRGPLAAALAGLLAAAGPSLVKYAAWEYADVPVGLLLVSGLGVIAIARERDHRGATALGGVLLGLASWTKNEGLAMFAASAAALAFALWRGGGVRALVRLGAPFLAASALLLLPLLLLRVAVPSSDYAADGVGVALSRIGDPGRWAAVAAGLGAWGDPRLNLSPLALAGVVLLARLGGGRTGERFVPGAVALCLAADLLAYLVTPWALRWQVDTSLGRVLLQLWPAAVAGALLALDLAATPQLNGGHMNRGTE